MLFAFGRGGTNIRLAVWELVEKQTQKFLLEIKVIYLLVFRSVNRTVNMN
ncbi:hypothetical protein MT390_02175 [Vibrio sp. 2-Bac 85]